MSACVVTTTVGSEEEAASLAREIVEARLGACVQITPIRSVYRWQGKVADEAEWLLAVKTRSDLYGRLEKFIAQRHPYDVPEIVQTPIAATSASYLAWLTEEADPD